MKKSKSPQKVTKAFLKLEDASLKFQKAITKFQKTFDTTTVGLDEWCESIQSIMSDIDEEIENEFQEGLFPD